MKRHIVKAVFVCCSLATMVYGEEPKPATARSATSSQATELLSSTKLIGASIHNKADEVVADVNSVILNKEGQALFVIAGVGGVAGIGESEVAIPWAAIRCVCKIEDGVRTCRPEIPMTVEQLKAAPQLKAAHHAELVDTAWTKQNAKYFSTPAPSVVISAGSLLSLAKISGVDVKGPNQQTVGQLDSVVMDVAKAQAMYGIISYGGVAGVGKTSTAVPFRSLTFSHHESDNTYTVTTEATAESIKAGPKVTPHEFPELNLKSFRDQIDTKSSLTVK